jgi:hypothetical protein
MALTGDEVFEIDSPRGRRIFFDHVDRMKWLELDSNLAAYQFRVRGDTLVAGWSIYGAFQVLVSGSKKKKKGK